MARDRSVGHGEYSPSIYVLYKTIMGKALLSVNNYVVYQGVFMQMKYGDEFPQEGTAPGPSGGNAERRSFVLE